MGTGHLMGGHNPDYTYNHQGACSSTGGEDPITTCVQWNKNQDRTMEMERETYQKIVDYMNATNYGKMPGQNGKQTDFSVLDEVLDKFNSIDENAEKESTNDFTVSHIKEGKLNTLENWFSKNGYTNSDGSPILLTEDKQGYSQETAQDNREKYFNGLSQSDYPSAMLPSG